MRTGLFGGDLCQCLWRTGTERAAGSGEQNAVHPLGPTRGIFRQALNAPEGTTAVLNAANEVAVEAFLAGKLRFDHIHAVNLATLDAVQPSKPDSLESLLALDANARVAAQRAAAALAL